MTNNSNIIEVEAEEFTWDEVLEVNTPLFIDMYLKYKTIPLQS